MSRSMSASESRNWATPKLEVIEMSAASVLTEGRSIDDVLVELLAVCREQADLDRCRWRDRR